MVSIPLIGSNLFKYNGISKRKTNGKNVSIPLIGSNLFEPFTLMTG